MRNEKNFKPTMLEQPCLHEHACELRRSCTFYESRQVPCTIDVPQSGSLRSLEALSGDGCMAVLNAGINLRQAKLE